MKQVILVMALILLLDRVSTLDAPERSLYIGRIFGELHLSFGKITPYSAFLRIHSWPYF
jgi:hypothetical protein